MFKLKSIFLIGVVLISVIVVGSVSGVFYLKHMKTENETAQQTTEQTIQQTETTQNNVEKATRKREIKRRNHRRR